MKFSFTTSTLSQFQPFTGKILWTLDIFLARSLYLSLSLVIVKVYFVLLFLFGGVNNFRNTQLSISGKLPESLLKRQRATFVKACYNFFSFSHFQHESFMLKICIVIVGGEKMGCSSMYMQTGLCICTEINRTRFMYSRFLLQPQLYIKCLNWSLYSCVHFQCES